MVESVPKYKPIRTSSCLLQWKQFGLLPAHVDLNPWALGLWTRSGQTSAAQNVQPRFSRERKPDSGLVLEINLQATASAADPKRPRTEGRLC